MGSICSRSRDTAPTTRLTDLSFERTPDPYTTRGEPKFSGRLPEHIYDVTFTQLPLGVVLTSDRHGRCAYVTGLSGPKNNSKLIEINGVCVELATIKTITEFIVKEARYLPITLTFCHPDGLKDDECPDPRPNPQLDPSPSPRVSRRK